MSAAADTLNNEIIVSVLQELSQPAALVTWKSYLLRHLLSCLSTSLNNRPAEAVCAYSNAGPVIASAWLDAALRVSNDTCLLTDLGTLAHMLCAAQPELAGLFVEALIVSSCSEVAADSGAGNALSLHPAALHLLPSLLEEHPNAAALAAQLLLSSPLLCTDLSASLSHSMGSVDYVGSVLRLLSAVLKHPSPAAAQLTSVVGRPTFAQAAKILAAIASSSASAAQPSSLSTSRLTELRTACMGILATLAASGCMMLDGCADSQGLTGGSSSPYGEAEDGLAEIAGNLLAGMKPCLLSSDMGLKLQAAQLMALLCGSSHPALQQQLINADLVEYLCECVRSKSGMAQYTGMTNSYGNWQQQQQASALAQEHAASLQVAVVTSLRCLSYEGHHFQQHIIYGLDTLIRLTEGAASSGNTPLLADLLALLVCALSQGQAQGSLPAPLTDMFKAVQLLPPIFPGPLAPGSNSLVVLSSESTAACVCACQLMEGAVGALQRARPGSQEMRSLQRHLVCALEGCLNGLASIATPSLPAYLTAAATALHAWMECSSSHIGCTDTAHILALLRAVCHSLAPSLLRLFHEVGDWAAIAAGIQALLASIRAATAEASAAEVQAAGQELCTHLLRLKFTSVCAELLAVLPTQELHSSQAVWRLLLALQQGAPEDTPEALRLVSVADGDNSSVVEQLAACRSLQSAMQLMAVHGPSVFSPLCTAPLAMIASALQCEDVLADPAWIMQAAVTICASCSPVSNLQDAAVLEAAIYLNIMVEGMMPQLHLGTAALPSQLKAAVQEHAQLQPACMELGSRLACWVLLHCQDLESLTAGALQQWLLDASQVSHATRQQVLSYLCTVLEATPALATILSSLLHQCEAAGEAHRLAAVLDLVMAWQQHCAPQASATLYSQGIITLCSRQFLQHRACTSPDSVRCMAKLLCLLQHLALWAGTVLCGSFALGNANGAGGQTEEHSGAAETLQEIMACTTHLCPHMLDAKARQAHLHSSPRASMLAAFLDLAALTTIFALTDSSLTEPASCMLDTLTAHGCTQLLSEVLALPMTAPATNQPHHPGSISDQTTALDRSGTQQQGQEQGRCANGPLLCVQGAVLQLHALVCLVQSMRILPRAPQAPHTSPLLPPALTTPLFATAYLHSDNSAKADALTVLWAGGIAEGLTEVGPPGVLLMQLQNAAVDAHSHIRSSGMLGLCTDLGVSLGQDDCWGIEVLSSALTHLASSFSSYCSSTRAMTSNATHTSALILVRMVPSLLLALRYVDNGMVKRVVTAFQTAVDRPSNSLLPLLMSPPQALASWVHALSARLARAGVLDAHLPRLREVCRVAVWQETMQHQQAGTGQAHHLSCSQPASSAAVHDLGGNRLLFSPGMDAGWLNTQQLQQGDLIISTGVPSSNDSASLPLQRYHPSNWMTAASQQQQIMTAESVSDHSMIHTTATQRCHAHSSSCPTPHTAPEHSLLCAALPLCVSFQEIRSGSTLLPSSSSAAADGTATDDALQLMNDEESFSLPRVVLSDSSVLALLLAWAHRDEIRRPPCLLFSAQPLSAAELLEQIK